MVPDKQIQDMKSSNFTIELKKNFWASRPERKEKDSIVLEGDSIGKESGVQN